MGVVSSFIKLRFPAPTLSPFSLFYSHFIESSQSTTVAVDPALDFLSQGASCSLLRAVQKGEALN